MHLNFDHLTTGMLLQSNPRQPFVGGWITGIQIYGRTSIAQDFPLPSLNQCPIQKARINPLAPLTDVTATNQEPTRKDSRVVMGHQSKHAQGVRPVGPA
ncbi:hypothetical protein L345_03247, partial [Ophiophagus hannah]